MVHTQGAPEGVPEGVRAGQAVDDTQGGSQPALYP